MRSLLRLFPYVLARYLSGCDEHRTEETATNAIDTHRGEGTNAVDTLGKGGNQREWHRLKDSLKGLHLGKDLKRLSTTTSRESGNGRKCIYRNDSGVVVGQWDLSQLLLVNRVDARVRSELAEQGASVEAFISWLLYAASPRGESIENPVSHAKSRLRQTPQAGAGESFDRLAELSPQDLTYLIERALQGTDKWVNNGYWKSCMVGASKARLCILAEQLGIRIDG